MPPRATIIDELQVGRGDPRPRPRRREWTALNGGWDFAMDPICSVQKPDEVRSVQVDPLEAVGVFDASE